MNERTVQSSLAINCIQSNSLIIVPNYIYNKIVISCSQRFFRKQCYRVVLKQKCFQYSTCVESACIEKPFLCLPYQRPTFFILKFHLYSTKPSVCECQIYGFCDGRNCDQTIEKVIIFFLCTSHFCCAKFLVFPHVFNKHKFVRSAAQNLSPRAFIMPVIFQYKTKVLLFFTKESILFSHVPC